MIAMRRSFGLIALLSAFAAPSFAQDLQSELDSGVAALRRGETEAALRIFEGILAGGPEASEMYELWKATPSDVWVDILSEGPRFALVGERMSDLWILGRKELRNDEEAIKALVAKTTSDDAVERRTALLELGANHGEYAVPYLLRGVADSGDEDRRVLSMNNLARMAGDPLPALAVALMGAEDAFLRRNIAFVLGNMGDARAAGFLNHAAANDADDSVRAAAASAAQSIGAAGDATMQLLQLGDDYHHRREGAIRAASSQDVMWSWQGRELQPESLPKFLYNDAMAALAYGAALQSDPSSLAAQAGLARAYVSQAAELEQYALAGALAEVGDEEALQRRVDRLSVLGGAVSTEALDLALEWSVESGDSISAAALSQKLSQVATGPTNGLQMAFNSGNGPMVAEAAVALGHIAARTGGSADSVVGQLGAVAGREIVRIVAIVDGDAGRSSALQGALQAEGVESVVFSSGNAGIATLRRLGGLDAIVIADNLSDVTTDAMLRNVRGDARFSKTPVLLATGDAANAAEAYGDRIDGTLGADSGAAPVLQAMEGGDASADRQLADALSMRASDVLSKLAMSGNTNLSAALPELLSVVSAVRPDGVKIPAMHALGASGFADAAASLVGVLSSDGSDELRAAAGSALAGIAARNPGMASAEAAQALMDVVTSDAGQAVRAAAASALGQMDLDAAMRTALLLSSSPAAN